MPWATPTAVSLPLVHDGARAEELLERLAPQVVTQHRQEARELARELERLPLALQGFCWGVQGYSMLRSSDQPNGAATKHDVSLL